jgi:hypothetical protein
MATAHLPTTAKVGLRTQGFTADRGQAESAKQMAPSPFDRETTAGMMMSSPTTAARIATTTTLRGYYPRPMTRRDIFAAGVGAAVMAVGLVGLQQYAGQGIAMKPLPLGATNPASATSPTTASVGTDETWRTANANLAQTVKLTQQRLEQNEAEKKALENELKAAQAKLAAAEGDGAPPRNAFDLTQDDWKELAKTGTVKERYPCGLSPEWHISPDQATALGLSPADAAIVEAAYQKEADRIASATQPGCAKILGNLELARRLGTRVCTEVISESVKDDNPDIQLVANIRAGNVPMPPADKLDPFATMLLAHSGSMQALQTELAKTFGPEDAKRLAFADELGSCRGTWGEVPPKH